MSDDRFENYEEEPKKKKRFRLFDSQREGKGVFKDEPITPDLRGFFRCFGRNFTKLLSVNLMMLLGCFPVIFALLGLSGLFKIGYLTPLSVHFSDFHASMLLDGSITPATMAGFGVYGIQIENTAMTATSYVMFALAALTLFTFGFVNVGATYVARAMVRGEPAFVWTDFFYAIKRNKKQAFFFGILDLILLFLIPFNFVVLLDASSMLDSLVFWLNLLFGILYFVMRFYIYLQIITFDLKIGKILKNSLIFAMIGFKRNFMAVLGILLLVLLTFVLLFGLGGALIPLGLAMPLFLLFSASVLMATFAAWYKIKAVMIDPAAQEAPQESPYPEQE